MEENAYQILGLPHGPEATDADIKKAYRKLVRKSITSYVNYFSAIVDMSMLCLCSLTALQSKMLPEYSSSNEYPSVQALTKHPDKNRDNPNAAAEFAELQKAYAILTDADARKALDDLLK